MKQQVIIVAKLILIDQIAHTYIRCSKKPIYKDYFLIPSQLIFALKSKLLHLPI